jgi:class 3 adenylate cyclase
MQLQTFARYPHAPTIVSRTTDPELKEKGFLVAEHPTRKLAVILHADVVGSTRLESGHLSSTLLPRNSHTRPRQIGTEG